MIYRLGYLVLLKLNDTSNDFHPVLIIISTMLDIPGSFTG